LAKKHAALRDSIIEVLTKAREEAGISQRELSRKLKEAATYIQEIEAGQHRVRAEEFIVIARALNREPAELLREAYE